MSLKTMTATFRASNLRRSMPTLLMVVFMFTIILRLFRDDNTGDVPSRPHRRYHNDSNIDKVLKTAFTIKDRPVLVTLVNDGYYDMVYSWICNTKHMGFHKQVMFIVTSEEGTAKMKELSPDINVVVINVEESMKGHQEYSRVGYVKIMALRTSIQSALVQNDIEVYAFECDSVFLKNPLPILRGNSGMYDIVFISNYGNPKAINGGFLYLFPTYATKETFKELNRKMQELYTKIKDEPSDGKVPTYENDQVYMATLKNERFSGLKSTVMPFSIFSDGKWYDIAEVERKQTRPVLIHNNWILGNLAKMNRLKNWGHWFLKEDKTCDLDNIRNFFPE